MCHSQYYLHSRLNLISCYIDMFNFPFDSRAHLHFSIFSYMVIQIYWSPNLFTPPFLVSFLEILLLLRLLHSSTSATPFSLNFSHVRFPLPSCLLLHSALFSSLTLITDNIDHFCVSVTPFSGFYFSYNQTITGYSSICSNGISNTFSQLSSPSVPLIHKP